MAPQFEWSAHVGASTGQEREHAARQHLLPRGRHRPRLRHPGRGGAHPPSHRRGALALRAQPPGAALRVPLRVPRRRLARPRAGLPAVGRDVMAERLRPHFGGALPGAVHRERVPPGPGHRHARRPPRLRSTVVASLSLGADWPMRFRPRATRPYAAGALPGDEVALLPRRSVLVLAGDARHRWMHGIDRGTSARETATRVSATFRTLAP